MELAVGTIISGKVTAITKFGAFVSLPGGKSGLVHISEVAAAFVSDVHDYLTEGQEVTVKILSVSPEGKINLSIKQAQPQQERPQPARSARPQGGRPGPRSGGRSSRPPQRRAVSPSGTGRSGHAAPGGAVLRGQAEAVHDPVRQQTVGAEPLYGGEAGQRAQEKIIENRQAEA